VDVDGMLVMGATHVTYGGQLSWLGDLGDGANAGEGALHVVADLANDLWLDLDAGVLAWHDPQGDITEAVMDRVGVGLSSRLGDSALVRMSARRLQEAPLPPELALLPTGYLDGLVRYDLWGMVDGVFWNGQWLGRDVLLSGNVTGGGIVGASGPWDRYWASPAVMCRVPAWSELSLRLGYRAGLGWTGEHMVDLGVGMSPWPGVRLDLSQQGGLAMLSESRQLLPSAASWLRVSAALSGRWHLGLSTRAVYGDAGTGIDAQLWIAAHEWL
jgi:hypothetical protein